MVARVVSTSVSSSVPRTLAIVEYLIAAELPPTSRELAVRFDVPPSSLTALLAALRELDYVVVDNGAYRPGPRLLGLGHLASRNAAVVSVRTALDHLVARTGETAFFCIPVDRTEDFLGNVLPVEQVESRDQIRYVGILGHRLAMIRSAAGLAILSVSEPASESAWGNAMNDVDHIWSRSEFDAFLGEIRRRGFAMLQPAGESSMSAAAPLLQNGRLVGALSIAGPAERIAALEPDFSRIFAEAQSAADRLASPGLRPA